MSFSFSFIAKGQDRAKALAEAQRAIPYVPGAVVSFVQAALDGLRHMPADTLFSVSADGHMPTGDAVAWAQGTAKIEVKPLTITE
jgi:hypothetical protein